MISIIVKRLLDNIGSKLLVGELVVEYELVAVCLGDVFTERGFEVRDGLRSSTDAGSLVLAFATDAGEAVQFRAHSLPVRHAVDAPHGEVVEDDGLRKRVVESASAKARLLEAGRVHEFVVVDWLLLQKFAGVSNTTSINLCSTGDPP